MWQSTTVRVVKKSSHEPISPSSIPLCTFFHPPRLGVFFMYSFCLLFLDHATIRNVYFDGRVLEELICPFVGLCAAPLTPEDISTGRKAWDQVENISVHIVMIHIHQ